MEIINNLFNKEVEKIAMSILEDDLETFRNQYKERLIIDNSKLLIFCMESLSYKIIEEILIFHPKEYKSLTYEEKCYFFYELYKKKYKFEKEYTHFINNVFDYINENYKISKNLMNFIHINSAKYAVNDTYKKIYLNNSLSLNQIKDLLIFIKSANPSQEDKDFYQSIFKNIILENKSFFLLKQYYNLLSLSLGAEADDYCFEIELFKILPNKSKEYWVNYVFENKNLEFLCFSFSINSLKKNGYSPIDLNVDFLYFLVKHLLINKQDYSQKDLIKLKKLKKMIIDNDFSKDFVYNDLIVDLESVLLKHTLEKSLNFKNKFNYKNKI